MLKTEDAVRRAGEWLDVEPERVGVHEFDHGWIVWKGPTNKTGAPHHDVVDSFHGVISREDGALSSWPAWPIEVITQQYAEWRETRGRFDDAAERALTEAGWRPGRHVGDHAWEWLAQLVASLDGEDDTLAVNDAARSFVDEFGRLMLVGIEGPTRSRRLLRLFPLSFHALPDPEWRPTVDAVRRVIATCAPGPACPVGVLQEGRDIGEIILDDAGAVHLVSTTEVRILGTSTDGALSSFLTEPLRDQRARTSSGHDTTSLPKWRTC